MPKVIHIEKQELWDEQKEEFVYVDAQELVIEHSLYSINLWEEKYHKPFMRDNDKTTEELLDYIKMMTLNEVDDSVYTQLTPQVIKQIDAYMKDTMTATTFSKEDEKALTSKMSNGFVTAELVYYWMTAENIPFEWEHRHINKLLTLIKVCSIKNKPDDKKKKLTSSDIQARRMEMEARRKQYHTNG